jgi:hypothetical protein
MKVELLVNLKIKSGQIIQAGTIFSDELVPIPESIMRRVNRGTAKIVSYSPSPIKKEVVQEPVKEPVVEKPKTKKPLLKKKGESDGKETVSPEKGR